ncbi:hypothetical protein D3C75_547280 [compost metagenome]
MLAVGEVDRSVLRQVRQDIDAVFVDDTQLVEDVADDQAVADEGADVDLPTMQLILLLEKAQRLIGAGDGARGVGLEGTRQVQGVALEVILGADLLAAGLEDHAAPQGGHEEKGEAEEQHIGEPAFAPAAARVERWRQGWLCSGRDRQRRGCGVRHDQASLVSSSAGSGWSA